MIERIIRWSAANRMIVLLAAAFITAAGLFAVSRTPLDAIPDLSDVQVIIRTPYPGQAPQIVESQVTYPIATTMLSAPAVRAVRAFSMFGDSFVTVIFEDGTDLYWARSRTLEYLNQATGRLPPGLTPALGPDATGVGWAYQYALVDRTGGNDLGQLRALQDWFLKYQLKEVPGVAEVASVGGMVRAFQVQVDPERLQLYRLSVNDVMEALKTANNETGGSVIERAEAEYMIRVGGYLNTLDDFRNIPLKVGEAGVPVTIGDIARVQIVPDFRRGIAELNGQGEVAGGVVVVRAGADTRAVIDAVKAKLEELKPSLPKGVDIVPVYDRSSVIDRAVENLTHKLAEEFIVVAIVCAIFLLHFRSSLVAILTLPLGVLAAFIVMYFQGVNANILSLGGIALAIGAMVDAAVVMIENAHKRLEHVEHEHGGMTEKLRRRTIVDAAAEVGPALFFSLLIITLSFLPVFSLEAQEGKLFKPLALTKTYSMAAAAGLSVTLIPVLMVMFIKGKIRPEDKNPINRALIAAYRPGLAWVMRWPKLVLGLALGALLITAWPLSRLGGEFMPAIAEGDLLYMPTALPGLSASKASELLQITNRMIKTVPEVKTVFGKAGRAETATDPAPLEMFETTIQLKPESEWRPGMTMDKIIAELDARVKVPGLANVFVQPIRNRIDMLATGIKSPVGVKVTGADLATLDRLGANIAQVVKTVPGTTSAISDRIMGGRYIDVQVDRLAAARYGLAISDVQNTAAVAVGGMPVGEKLEGLARFPINVRFPRETRDSVEALRNLPIVAPTGGIVPLGAVATIQVVDGPVMIKSENARPSVWVYVDVRDRDIVGFVNEARQMVANQVKMPSGYSLSWSGQFEYAERASKRLAWIVPLTIGIIFLLLYMAFRRIRQPLIVLLALPFALVGGVWLIYLLGHAVSVATVVGFIALAGLAAEFGVIMLVYLDRSIEERIEQGKFAREEDLEDALMEGAVLRVRPKAMTAAVILAGLFPLLVGTGTGSEVMQRLAAPMVGGMITAPLLSLFVLPAIYKLLGVRHFLRAPADEEEEPAASPQTA
ncbi:MULTISPECIES: efflux RND transporter permease subunit [unclassified Sphingopyxis]|jgi:Cu(I)/Ag(I) efflux system membrane protein CusA/SilA|uniref:efflux RND transporter permease subunit n=1 Tax=Sphingomonadales TaxID=204457 RepID=UPI0010FA0B1A|nr:MULTISPECIES: efflux RND transporter permease subunit [unclassified Sphingopyxis]MBR2172927.1 efflux RND transporter permease subunit [Sphingopyxis sp.]MDT7529891.1 efflux RND transporter permease subunit [Sphingopyxis sp. SE2]